jgi:hypothetical protein
MTINDIIQKTIACVTRDGHEVQLCQHFSRRTAKASPA